MIDKETQIKVLLYGNPLKFACETLDVNNMMHHEYSEVFTVSKEEVYEYTSIHGIPESGPMNRDPGFYYYEEEGKWYTLLKERGQVFDEKNFEDEKLAKKYIVTTLLQLRMTGSY